MSTVRTNIINGASTQYASFDFTSYCVFNGVVLGAGTAGVHKLNIGDDDNGVDINAYFIPYTVDFNDDHPKRFRRVYVGGELDGQMKLTITGNDDSVNGPFYVDYNTDETKQVKMFSIDRGEGNKFVYADLKFENVTGSFFAIDSLNAVYSTHARRRN